MVRKAVEQAIGLPMSAFTERLLSTALHNMVGELIEGHLSNQKLRTIIIAADRRILHQIGWAEQNVTPSALLPDSGQRELKMVPFVRNINP